MFIKSSICGVLTLLSTTSAFALTCVNDYGGTASCASSSSKAGDCETLGFSKDSVANCEHYIYCPFDTNYKRCVSFDCTGYTLFSCPTNGYCNSCKAGGYTYYTLDGCNNGYVKSDNSCTANPCTGYHLSSCPTGATSCSNCLSGTTTKYKVNGCKNGYTASGNTCVAAACSGYTLSSCPSSATSCSTCLSGTTTKYKVNGCKNGYTKFGNTCAVATCSGYTLSSCPTGATSCSTCLSGTTTKYKVNSCKSGYTASENTCVVATCSGYTLSSCPTNGNCYDCKSGTKTLYKLLNCKSGYMLLTDKTGCTKYCQGVIGARPMNQDEVYSYCTNANGTYGYLTSCRNGTTLVDTGLMRYCKKGFNGGGNTDIITKPGDTTINPGIDNGLTTH